jgi:Tfp pilus assembly protein PilF
MTAWICTFLGFLLCLSGIAVANQSISSDSATAHIGKGYELVQNDRFAEAAEEFRAALARNPSALDARYQLAICLFALGEQDASRKEFERLRTETKNDPNVLYYLARLDLLAGDAPSAIRRLVPLMRHPPFADASFYLGSAYLSDGDIDDAIKWLRIAAQSDPHDFRSHYRLARALQRKELDKQAEQEYALSTEMREHYNESARQSVACVQAINTQSSDAVRRSCERLFDPNDPDKLTTLGMLYGENGRYRDAIRPLTRAAQLDPESFEVYHNLGLTYFRLRQFAEARGPLEKAVALRPNFFGSNALLGATLYSLKDDTSAYHVLDIAHRLKPDDADTTELLFRISLVLADKSAAGADYAASLKFLSTAAVLRPGIPEIERRIAEIKSIHEQSR